MARSGYVYVVLGSEREPIAGFTVKREMIRWLRANMIDPPRECYWTAYRIPDAGHNPLLIARLDIAELIGASA